MAKTEKGVRQVTPKRKPGRPKGCKQKPRPRKKSVEEIVSSKPTLPPEKKGRGPSKKGKSEEDILRETIAAQQEVIKKLSSAEGFTIVEGEDEIETLMDVPNRKRLSGDDVQSQNKLVRCVVDKPYQYKRFLQLLREGASLLSACLATDIGQRELVYLWIRQGVVDLNAEMDTYYSRFYRDIMRSTAIRMAEVEGQVSIDDPKTWLRNGPGRLIHSLWRDDPAHKSQKTIDMNHNHPRVTSQIEDAEVLRTETHIEGPEDEEDESQHAPVTETQFDEALAALAEAGVMDSPEGWAQALKLQAGKITSMDELDIPEASAPQTTMGGNHLLLTQIREEAESSA